MVYDQSCWLQEQQQKKPSLLLKASASSKNDCAQYRGREVHCRQSSEHAKSLDIIRVKAQMAQSQVLEATALA